MSYLSTARTAIIAKGAAVTGIVAALPRLPESLPGSPVLVLGNPRWQTKAGDREQTTYIFDLDLYVERLFTDDQTIATADDLIDLIQAAYAQGVTLGSQPGTTQCLITGGSTDWFEQGHGGPSYFRVRFALMLYATRQRGYTA